MISPSTLERIDALVMGALPLPLPLPLPVLLPVPLPRPDGGDCNGTGEMIELALLLLARPDGGEWKGTGDVIEATLLPPPPRTLKMCGDSPAFGEVIESGGGTVKLPPRGVDALTGRGGGSCGSRATRQRREMSADSNILKLHARFEGH